MNVTILKEFRDRDDFTKVYAAGSEAEFDAERTVRLQILGLAAVAYKQPDGLTGEQVDTETDKPAKPATARKTARKPRNS